MLLLQLVKHLTHYGIDIDTYENIHKLVSTNFPSTGLDKFPSSHAMDFQSDSVYFRFHKAEKSVSSESNDEQTDLTGLDGVIERMG